MDDFYLAGSIRTTAFGFNRAKTLDASLRRVVAAVREQGCNSLEIDNVVTDSFLGVPRVTVSAHPRHIQRGMVFTGSRHANGAAAASAAGGA
jgi:hypothetical protein